MSSCFWPLFFFLLPWEEIGPSKGLEGGEWKRKFPLYSSSLSAGFQRLEAELRGTKYSPFLMENWSPLCPGKQACRLWQKQQKAEGEEVGCVSWQRKGQGYLLTLLPTQMMSLELSNRLKGSVQSLLFFFLGSHWLSNLPWTHPISLHFSLCVCGCLSLVFLVSFLISSWSKSFLFKS